MPCRHGALLTLFAVIVAGFLGAHAPLQGLVENVVQQAVEVAGLGLAADDLTLGVEPQWRAHYCTRVLFAHIVDLQIADSRLDPPLPHTRLLGRGARLVLDRHDFLAVAIPEISNRALPTRERRLGLSLLALCPAASLGPLAQGGVSLAGPRGLVQVAELLLRQLQGPAFRGPAERLLDLLAGGGEAERIVAVELGTVLAGRVLAVADAGCGGEPLGCHRTPLPRLVAEPVPNLSLDRW